MEPGRGLETRRLALSLWRRIFTGGTPRPRPKIMDLSGMELHRETCSNMLRPMLGGIGQPVTRSMAGYS